MNNMGPIRNCHGVQGRLNWMLGYNFIYVVQFR